MRAVPAAVAAATLVVGAGLAAGTARAAEHVPSSDPSTPVTTTTTSPLPSPTTTRTVTPPRPAPTTTTPKPVSTHTPGPSGTTRVRTPKKPTPATTTPTSTTSSTTSPAPVVPPVPEDASVGAKAAGRQWGIDTSVWQHPGDATIDFKAAFADGPATTPFVFVKVSEGTSTDSNPYAATDRAAARAAGALVGAYHYAIPSVPVRESALAQARVAAGAYGGKAKAGMLPLALDLESNPNALSGQDMAQWALTWLGEVKRLTGRTPLLYTYPAFFAANVAADPALAAYPLWIAHYGQELNSPTVPAPWASWTFWQFSSKGDLAGFDGPVDLNVFAGTGADLSLLAGVLPHPKGVRAGAPVTGPLAGQALLEGLLGARRG